MSRFRMVFLATAAALLVATGAFAVNSISVPANGEGALNGTNFGLKITMDGSTNATNVISEHPTDETHFLTRFWLQPANMLSIPLNSSVRVGQISQQAGAGALVVVFLRHDDPVGDNTFRVNVWVKEDDGSFRFGGGQFSSFDSNPVARQWEIEWGAASAPGANNGMLRITRVGGPSSTISNLDNDTHDVDRAFWGLLAPVPAGITGHYYFDEYESYR